MGISRNIIAGSRSITDPKVVERYLKHYVGWGDVWLCGMAKGVDLLAKDLIERYGGKIEEWPADWAKYGKKAGPMRNDEMARNAEMLVAIWDGESRGTMDMIKRALDHRLEVHVHIV